jgi:hypothetical protein
MNSPSIGPDRERAAPTRLGRTVQATAARVVPLRHQEQHRQARPATAAYRPAGMPGARRR